jgi:hypothetical protein
MTTEELSICYFIATDIIHRETTALYEELHTIGGNPIADEELIRNLCSQYLLKVRAELDMVKSARKEYGE